MKKIWTKSLRLLSIKSPYFAKKDSAQEKAEREKRDKEISNALHEKELAKRSSAKWKQMQKIRENLPARKARSEVISTRETVARVRHFGRNRVW